MICLLIALAGAVALRLGVAGPAGVASIPAGVAFATALFAICVAAGYGPVGGGGRTVLLLGIAGAVTLCAVPLLSHLVHSRGAADPAAFPTWAIVVSAVAVTEEMLLRGALWTALSRWSGERSAVIVSTAVFALVHVPFYGIGVLPLDLAVGLLLAGLRQASGGWGAPALTHALADLAGWWLL